MTETEWLDAIDAKAQSIDSVPATTPAALRLVELALTEHPDSCRLLNRRGDLIQLLDDQLAPYPLGAARESYEQACAVHPCDPEAYESLGHYFRAVDVRLGEAEMMFRKAIERGAGASAWAALAEMLAESGRLEEARALLSPGTCPYADTPEVEDVRHELEGGRS